MEFEWNEEKAEANLAKHGIDFEDAIAIFEGATGTGTTAAGVIASGSSGSGRLGRSSAPPSPSPNRPSWLSSASAARRLG